MLKKQFFNWGIIAFLIASSFNSLFAQDSRVVTTYGTKSYYLTGDNVEIATWKNGALGTYTAIHDDWGSTTLGNVYLHLDSICLNRGIYTSSAAISGSCDIPMTELAKKFIRHGHEIHSHSVTHTDGKLQSEIANSRTELESKLGVPVQFYVFPFDQWDDQALQYVENAGYLGARAGDRQPYIDAAVASGTIPNLTNPSDFSDPYRVLFDVYPRTNSGYKNVPDNGDPIAWLKRYAKDAVDHKSWAIHEFHDISSANNLCIPIDQYRDLMDYVGAYVAENKLWTSGPTEVIRYRFTREYCGDPALTQNGSGYTLSFGTPKNSSELEKFKTSISVFIKTQNISSYISTTQNGEVIPSFKVSDNYFSVYADPTKGNVEITESLKPWAKYPFYDPQDTIPSDYDEWNAGSIYNSGDIVFYQGIEYRALWWAQNNNPLNGQPWVVQDDVSNMVAVAARAANNGSISNPGKTITTKGSSLTYTITPDAGYVIDYVNIDMENVGAITSYTFNNLQKSHTIEVVFSEPYVSGFSINASATEGGTISPSGTINIAEGSNASFSASASTGYQFDGFLVDETLSTLNPYPFTNITENHTIVAQFSSLPPVTITATAGTGGSISPSGAVSVSYGADQAFTIEADDYYTISTITVNGSIVTPVTSTYTFSEVTEDQTIAVEFSAVPMYSINSSVSGSGTITPNGTVLVEEHGSQTYTIDANAGNTISKLVVDGDDLPAASSHTFNDVTEAHSIVAYFEAVPTYTITATAATGGSISPNGETTVTEGDDQSYTISTDAGYSIDSVIVDGAMIGNDASYIFNNITANHTIHVIFKTSSTVPAWDPNESWTNYNVGDQRSNGGYIWECTAVAYSFYEPSGPWGYLGWKKIGPA